MALVHTVFRESGLLELSIDVAREHECPMAHALRPSAQYRETFVWNGVTIKPQSVPIETPRKFRMLRKPSGVGHVLEREALMPKRGVRSPEAVSAAKIRQARIHAHSGACSDEQTGCFSQPGDSFFPLFVVRIEHFYAPITMRRLPMG